MNKHQLLMGAGLLCAPLLTTHALADADEDLAKKLANPIAALISLPFQYNYDSDIGPANGHKSTLNIQPVIPIEMNQDWNIISRTILPLTHQENIAGYSGSQSGSGDVVQSLFFSPKAPTTGGWILGAGPVFLIPTASDKLLGAEKWGTGPTGIALKQEGQWTYGVLANHIWSFTGNNDRADVSLTYLQPFVSYITQTKTTFSLNTESTYDWNAQQWSVPINASVSQLFKMGNQPMQLSFGLRYWAHSPDSGPEGWGFRVAYILLFPK